MKFLFDQFVDDVQGGSATLTTGVGPNLVLFRVEVIRDRLTPGNFADCQSLSFRYNYFQWRRPPQGGARRWLWSGFGGGYGGWNTNTNRCEMRYANTAGPFEPYDTRFVIGLLYKGERHPFMLGGHISY